ncbi:MAG: hypothetical protein J6U13_04855 [Salinivirgaceae bacterium]|nr:hypothetical protein [Salinivirgaceae bacterium]
MKLTKYNADLAQDKVNNSAKDSDNKKDKKTLKTLDAIREDDYGKNELYQLIQEKAKNNFKDGFFEIIKKINDTNSTRLSNDEKERFADNVSKNKDSILNKIEYGDVEVVNELAEKGAPPRHLFSFASKFSTYLSRYHFDNDNIFMPYDRVLQSILPYYAWVYCGEKDIPNFKDKHQYGEYIGLVRKIIEQSQKMYGEKGNLTLKEFDRLLWYKYKGLLGEDLIGEESAKINK